MRSEKEKVINRRQFLAIRRWDWWINYSSKLAVADGNDTPAIGLFWVSSSLAKGFPIFIVFLNVRVYKWLLVLMSIN